MVAGVSGEPASSSPTVDLHQWHTKSKGAMVPSKTAAARKSYRLEFCHCVLC